MVKLIFAFFLVAVSTACYFAPVWLSPNFDLKEVQPEFYQYYAYTLAGSFLLTAVYAFYLALAENKLGPKIVFIWLVIGETYTFLNHAIRKIFKQSYPSELEMILTWGAFAICLYIFGYAAVYRRETTKYDPKKTYIVRFSPKNIFGLINYIIRHAGHIALYQDGLIYKFSQGEIVQKKIKESYIKNKNGKMLFLEEIKRVEKIKDLIGTKYDLLRFNCNHLINYAAKN